MAKKPDPTEVTVTYDLFDLPTAFHKAGLAGLVLLIESLKARKLLTGEDARYAVTPTTATVTFTESLLQRLMDDLYDARVVEVAVKAKWAGAEVKREEMVEEEVDGKKSRTKRFIYDQVQPKGAYFDNVFDGDKEVWRKLWRDMLWAIPRGRPTTREPYNQRAAGQPCKEGPNGWDDLLKVEKARAKGQVHTAEVSSALLLGAQAVNAEGVPFEGRAEHNLLLHFWPLTVLLYVPQSVDREGATEFVGYTVAVPEVANVEEFVADYPKVLAGLSKDVRGFRPAGAVIDLPAAGALEALAAITAAKAERDSGLEYTVGGMDYLHLVKQGNNVKTMKAGRVAADCKLIAAYRKLVPPPGQFAPFRSTLFRRGLLVALLERQHWWQPFAQTFKTFEATVFLRPIGQPATTAAPKSGGKQKNFRNGKLTEAGKKRPPQFAADAAQQLRQEFDEYTQLLERLTHMPDAPRPPAPLPVLVEQVVRSYLLGKAKKKCNIDPKTKMKELTKEQQADVYKRKRDVAQEAFLAAKSRHDQDFIAYFSEVLCSAGTYFDRNTEDFQAFAGQLIDGTKTADIKTLTLLSLSANS